MPIGLGKTGSSAVKTPNATHSKIFQNGDNVPVRKNKQSNKAQNINALKHNIPLMNYLSELKA